MSFDEVARIDPRTSAGAEVVALRPATSPAPRPDGECQIAVTDPDGTVRLLDVVSWRRLDQGPIVAGQEFSVTVQARASRDLRLPLHSATRRFVLTLNPAESDEVVVGDVTRTGGWLFGVRLIGVRPAEQRLPVIRPFA